MTPEQEAQLLKRVAELEKKSIQVNMSPTERENIKNALFDGFYQSSNTAGTVAVDAPYLEVKWKDKIIYIPYYV